MRSMKNTPTAPAPLQQVALVGPVADLAAALLPHLLAAMPPPTERYMRPEEAAEHLGIGVKRVYFLIAENRIPHTGKVFGDPRVPLSLLDEYARRVAVGNVAGERG